jgi:hypothetical protein
MSDASETPSPDAPLPTIRTALGREAVLERLEKAWRRGKLPGFRAVGPGLFRAEAYGNPFPSELIATPSEADGALELRFTTRMVWKLPAFFAVVLLLSLQPGMWLTDSMLVTYSDWYYAHIETWWWYLPMWVLSVPWMWKAAKKSRVGAQGEAHKAIAQIAKTIDAEVGVPTA